MKFDLKVSGLPQAKAAFKALPDAAQARYGEASFATAKAIVAKAKARVRVRYGILRGHLNASYSKRTGIAKAGVEKVTVIVGDKRDSPGRRAHLIEFGHGGPHPAKPYPFMRPSAESEREAYVARVKNATDAIAADMAAKAAAGV